MAVGDFAGKINLRAVLRKGLQALQASVGREEVRFDPPASSKRLKTALPEAFPE